jgi:hypothetical protein
MIIRRGLLRIFWRQTLPATLIGAMGFTAYVLLWPDVMTARDFWPAALVFVQCLLLAGLLGRIASPTFGFIHSRGYSRDALWSHMMLASALSALAAWTPAALIVWTGLRCEIRDHVFQSPYFPLMASCETRIPWIWLVLYPLIISIFHYAWIRRAQPTKGQSSGGFIAVGSLIALFMAFDMIHYFQGWFAWLSGVSYLAALICLALGGRTLYRSLEVRA